jgi:beta-fructofuranosidase
MLYTGIRPAESQCLAVADDPELKTWNKLPHPVIAGPPSGVEVNGFRDPSPWQQGGWWYTVLGTGIAGKGGAVLLYRSRDVRNWEFMHVLAQREQDGPGRFDPVDPWEVWECPEFFPLGDRHVLIYSTLGRVYWQCGKLDPENMTFHADQSGILDYGSYYAAKTQLDAAGNRIVWGWVQETRPPEAYRKAGWAGMMSLPRVLSLAADGRLRIDVAPEVNQLRLREQRLQISTDEQVNQRNLSALGLEGCCEEIVLRVRRTADPFELVLSGSAQSAEPWLRLRYDPAHRDRLFIEDHPVAVSLRDSDDLECRFHVDGSVIESLVNRQVAWTKRFYYAGPAQTLRIQWKGKISPVSSLSVWPLSPISDDRLTT